MVEGEENIAAYQQSLTAQREAKEPLAASIPTHKQREQLRRDFVTQMRGIRERDTAHRLPNGTIGDLLSSPELAAPDRLGLINTVKARLKLAGALPSQPGLDELSSSYQRLLALEQQQLNEVDLDQFYTENPDVRVDPSVRLVPGGKREQVETTVERKPYSFDLETQVADHDRLSFLIVDDHKGHDAIGVSKNPDGSLSIAVADGVSGGVIPKVASRLAVRVGLQEMQQAQNLGPILERVFHELQTTDIPLMARKEIQDWGARQTTSSDPMERSNISMYIDELKRLSDKGNLTGTTLGLIRYDNKAGQLQMALKSDTSVRVFHADGTVSPYQNPDNSQQLHYESNPNASYSHGAEKIRDVDLKPGDLILTHTDGLKDDAIRELSQRIVALRKIGGRLDAAAMYETKNILSRDGVSDDVTAAFIYHQ